MIVHATPVPLFRLTSGELAIDSLTGRQLRSQVAACVERGLGTTRWVAPVTPEPRDVDDTSLIRLDTIPDLEVVASYSTALSRSGFWRSGVAQWRRDLGAALQGADLLVASAVGDPLRPAPYIALGEACWKRLPTAVIFGIHRTGRIEAIRRELGGPTARWRPRLEHLQSVLSKGAVRFTDVQILKVGNAYDRLSGTARNPRPELLTQFLASEVMDPEQLNLHTRSETDPIRVVYFGQLHRHKRVDKAIAVVDQLGPEVELTIIGDGPDRPHLESVALRASAKVEFLGQVPYETELLDLLATFDYQIFASANEDTPRSILDGFARGLPLIGSRTRFTEYLVDGGAPILFLEDREIDAGDLVEDLGARKQRAVAFAATISAERWAAARADAFHEAIANH